MAKDYYDQKIGPNTDWGGDASTGGKQVKGSRVQEYIKGEIADLHAADGTLDGRLDTVEAFDEQADGRLTQIEGSIAGVIETAAADHERAEADHTTSQEWNDHPPYIGDGRNGDKDYWYLWVNHQYVKSSYAKGDDLDWNTMTSEEYQRLVENVKQDIVFANDMTCEEIIEELS